MRFLLFAIPLAEAFIKPISNELTSRSSDQLPCSCPKVANRAHPGYCESGWTYYNETDACYKVARTWLYGGVHDLNWNFFLANFGTAENVCITVGGHLTSIHSYKENHFVAELAKSGITQTKCCPWVTWIGLVRLNGSFTWTDGTKVDFVNWEPLEPNNYQNSQNCVHMHPDPYEGEDLWYQRWGDFSCTNTARSYVCKKMALH